MNTAEIIAGFNNGDERAFKQLFDEFLGPLVYFASQITGSKQEAEDIVLNTFNKLWSMRDKFKTIENIKAFLYITVRNNCLNYLKSEKRKRKAQREIQYTSEETSHESIEDHVHVKLINAQLVHRFNEEVNALPPQCKKVVRLSYFEGYSNAQIASTLNTSLNTVEVQKTKGLKRLRMIIRTKKLLKPTLIFVLTLLFS
jgi:RNA polymerase sigma-70 factor (ECF subfamily)